MNRSMKWVALAQVRHLVHQRGCPKPEHPSNHVNRGSQVRAALLSLDWLVLALSTHCTIAKPLLTPCPPAAASPETNVPRGRLLEAFDGQALPKGP